jgi:hypothetical protein
MAVGDDVLHPETTPNHPQTSSELEVPDAVPSSRLPHPELNVPHNRRTQQ